MPNNQLKEVETTSYRKIEKTLFEFSCLAVIGVMSYAAIQILVVYGYYPIVNIELGLAAVALALLVSTRLFNIFHVTRYLFILFISIGALYFWFRGDSFYPPISLGIIGVIIICIILTPYKFRYYSLIISSGTILFLVYDLKQKPLSKFLDPGEETAPFTYGVIAISICLVIWFLKREFDKDRYLLTRKTYELKKINEEYFQSLKEKDLVITELKTTRDQLIESEKMASIGKLTAGLAHELNNPLNYIGGIVKPIKRDIEDLISFIDKEKKRDADELVEEIISLLDHVVVGTRKASSIIDNLVKLSPAGDPAGNTDFDKIDINHTIKSCQILVEKSRENVQFNLYLQKNLFIKGNEIELHKVIENIIMNGVQAVPEDRQPVIEIRSSQRDKSVILSFTDNGNGISKTDKNRIFDPFYSTKSNQESSGLELYFAYSIIKKHSGEIRVESDPGLGTTITVYLPSY